MVCRGQTAHPAGAEDLTILPQSLLMGSILSLPALPIRLDWILISEELEFAAHRILPQLQSDYSAVLASVRLRSSSDQPEKNELP